MLISPETLYAFDERKTNEIQIFGCIITAGILGGLTRQFHTNLNPSALMSIILQGTRERPLAATVNSSDFIYVKFWTTLFSLFVSFFVSVVLFLLLRAGLRKTAEVDTFNKYGVSGVAALSGYFSENIMRRLSRLFENFFETREGA